MIEQREGGFELDAAGGQLIGQMQQFHGNVGVLLRAYAYIRALGLEGLRAVSEQRRAERELPVGARCATTTTCPTAAPVLHEVVFSGTRQRREHGVRTYDIAKRLIDYGFHPPTVYFPLIVDEALMIEPTETESRESIEALAEALIAIAEESKRDPEAVRAAPTTSPIGRMDEADASRHPVLRWRPRED